MCVWVTAAAAVVFAFVGPIALWWWLAIGVTHPEGYDDV